LGKETGKESLHLLNPKKLGGRRAGFHQWGERMVNAHGRRTKGAGGGDVHSFEKGAGIHRCAEYFSGGIRQKRRRWNSSLGGGGQAHPKFQTTK